MYENIELDFNFMSYQKIFQKLGKNKVLMKFVGIFH